MHKVTSTNWHKESKNKDRRKRWKKWKKNLKHNEQNCIPMSNLSDSIPFFLVCCSVVRFTSKYQITSLIVVFLLLRWFISVVWCAFKHHFYPTNQISSMNLIKRYDFARNVNMWTAPTQPTIASSSLSMQQPTWSHFQFQWNDHSWPLYCHFNWFRLQYSKTVQSSLTKPNGRLLLVLFLCNMNAFHFFSICCWCCCWKYFSFTRFASLIAAFQ